MISLSCIYVGYIGKLGSVLFIENIKYLTWIVIYSAISYVECNICWFFKEIMLLFVGSAATYGTT